MTDTQPMTATAANTALPKAYDPGSVEGRIYAAWLAADVFAPDGKGSRADPDAEPFVVIQPPPNITGALHLGHALTFAVEDAMVRHARMTGRPTLWLPGLDHASIAAQYVLDKILAKEGETRQSLGRERYLERMWQFINETREVMLGQERRLGLSLDWSRLRFTMDEGSAKAVRVSFAQLHREGLAYRTEALINWCPGCRTSVSDLEVIPTPERGTLWTIRYHLLDASGQPSADETISVATTRPETLLGDTAVAVHPDDARYRELVGRIARVPFVERDVPVIADPAVDPAFGTGAVKITPAHDQDDYEMGKRHGLPMITVLADDASINEAGDGYAGLDRYEARTRIVEDLAARGDLAGEREHDMLIGRCERSNDVIEPRLKTQWFVRATVLAGPALAASREGRMRFVPSRFEKIWEHWLTNIRDWNVSRQLWWGHRIPAWYCPDGHITVTADEHGPDACEVCGRPAGELVQDPDIFDTWFSSGLWPFSTLGWPDDTPDLRRYYPGTVMETGYEIIFFWIARMMMLGIHFLGDVPFRTVYLHGLVRDPYGQKMSKTKGNVEDPLAIIDDIGADALRFALLHGVSPGNDMRISRAKLDGARNFANKVWNVTRFVVGARPQGVDPTRPLTLPEGTDLGAAESWILARVANDVAAASQAMDALRFSEASRVAYDGLWSAFADWYVEIAKVRLADPNAAVNARAATWSVLAWSLDAYLRLLHPIMPFLTEEAWSHLPHRADDGSFLMVSSWPAAGDASAAQALVEPSEAATIDRLIELIGAIRNARVDAGIDAARWLPGSISVGGTDRPVLEELRPAIERLARLRPLELIARSSDRQAKAGTSARTEGELVVLGADLEAHISTGGAATATDRARLERELAEAETALERAEARLADGQFTSRAPAEVVAGTRTRAVELRERIALLRARMG
jgi:valyl-tRNA synthetase